MAAFTKSQRIRKQHLLREAEGYLELVAMCDQPFSPQLAAANVHSMSAHRRTLLAEKCLAALQEIETEFGASTRFYFLQGQAFRMLERHEEAIASLELCLAVDDKNLDTYLAVAWCYKRVDRLDMAVAALETAIEIEPTAGILHFNLSCYWALAECPELAVKHLSIALELDEEFGGLVDFETDFDSIRQHPDFVALTSALGTAI